MDNIIIFDIIGWIGMITVLVAYFLLSVNIIKNGVIYQVLNFVAALLMAVALFPKNAWFSFALQVAWGIIALVSLIKLKRAPRTKKRKTAR